MVNLFRLLGLPDPAGVQKTQPKNRGKSVDPGPQADDRFHDLGQDVWSERTSRIVPRPDRRVVYLKPDNLHRLPLDGAERSLTGGDMILVDLSSLTPCQVNRMCAGGMSGQLVRGLAILSSH